MGWRFQKRVKILPGVTLNLSKRGASVSFGERGARFTVGPKGTRETVGIPGTGISYSTVSKPGGRKWLWIVVIAAALAIYLLLHLAH
jgi:Protein of unknown function (DUF4236)